MIIPLRMSTVWSSSMVSLSLHILLTKTDKKKGRDSLTDGSSPPRGGVLLYLSQVCAAPKGMVLAPFRTENGYGACTFCSGIGYGFVEGTTGL